jgi:protein-S-isoprenylcysteine O-methyltransferase Ste14
VAVPPTAGRVLVLGAAALLLIDGVTLLGLGIWARRPGLALAGGALLAGAGLVLWSWQRQRRRLEEIVEGRRDLRADTEALRRLTRR